MITSEILHKAPLLPIPSEPRLVQIGSRQYSEYASPDQISPHVQALSNLIKMRDFEHIFVNTQGGRWIYEQFRALQNFSRTHIEIKYNRPPKGFGAVRTLPIPHEYRHTDSLVFEDVWDSGGSLAGIRQDAPNFTFVVAVRKVGVPNQIPIQNIHVAVEMHNRWAGGLGMNLDNGPDQQAVRDFSGIIFISNS